MFSRCGPSQGFQTGAPAEGRDSGPCARRARALLRGGKADTGRDGPRWRRFPSRAPRPAPRAPRPPPHRPQRPALCRVLLHFSSLFWAMHLEAPKRAPSSCSLFSVLVLRPTPRSIPLRAVSLTPRPGPWTEVTVRIPTAPGASGSKARDAEEVGAAASPWDPPPPPASSWDPPAPGLQSYILRVGDAFLAGLLKARGSCMCGPAAGWVLHPARTGGRL